MSEWKELKTLQEVAAAQVAGEEIEYGDSGNGDWNSWSGRAWFDKDRFRSRPAKKTKTIVLREALVNYMGNGWFFVVGEKSSIESIYRHQEIKWLDTPERIVEVEE